MSGSCGGWMLCGIAMLSHAEGLPVDICLYNYAQVPAPVLERAKSHAAWALERAGIRTTWHHCPSAEPACSTARRADRLEVRVLTSSRVPGGAPGTQLGFALQPADGAPGTLANVLADRSRQWAADRDMEEAGILGHAMAHELGHLLLGPGCHAAHGLMAERWGPAELRQARQGALCFSSAEAARMSARLQRLRLSRQAGASISRPRD